jgi:hypothetical protein
MIGYKKTRLTEKITDRQLKSVFIQRSGVILCFVLNFRIICCHEESSLIFGIFLYPLFVAIPGLLLCPVPFTSNRMGSIKTEFKHLFQKQKLINYFLSIAIFVMPIVEILLLQYIGGISTINEVAAPEFNIALSNILLFTFLLIFPFLILRDLPPRYIILLLPLMFAATVNHRNFCSVRANTISPYSIFRDSLCINNWGYLCDCLHRFTHSTQNNNPKFVCNVDHNWVLGIYINLDEIYENNMNNCFGSFFLFCFFSLFFLFFFAFIDKVVCKF